MPVIEDAQQQSSDEFGVEHGSVAKLRSDRIVIKRPFTIVVAKMTSTYVDWAASLRSKVYHSNSKSLLLDDLGYNEQVAALRAYRLSPEQARDPTLALITGFELEVPGSRLVVLEGLGTGVLQDIVTELGWPEGAEIDQFQVLMNSSLGLAERYYGSMGVHLPRIVLQRPITELLKQQELYFQGHPLNKCLSGLCCVEQLLGLQRLADAMRFAYFPSVGSLSSIQLELAEPEEPVSLAVTERLLFSRAGLTFRSNSQHSGTQRFRRSTKAALDMTSPACRLQHSDDSPDHVQRNIEQVHARSERNKQEHPRPQLFRLSDVDAALVTSPYSAASHNSGALATQLLQSQLAAEHGSTTLFSYSETYQNSGAFSLVDEESRLKVRSVTKSINNDWFT